MAYVNVADWKTNQVCEWLKGLDSTVLPYVHSFTHNSVNGQQLLNLRPEDLEQLGVQKIGHQEIILEAVEYLRNFHYELDRENLQVLAMRLSCQAQSLHNELCRQTDSKPVSTQALSDVVAIITVVKPLVRWLDRSPFSGHLDYNEKKSELLKLSLEMATCAQRDRFADKPIEEIRSTCEQMAKLADYIIQEVSDPMILQPTSLDLATLKKKSGDDLGFCILPSFHGAHQIAEIKFGSAAHQCGKMEEGDEIVQVNYQTVVGWERKNVLELFRESPSEILLTLKRRPRHTKVYGQIYIKPYRLPSNKKMPYGSRWQHNLPSPRPELLTIPDFIMPLPKYTPKIPSPKPPSIIDTVDMLDTMTTDSSGSDSETETPSSVRLYNTKPRSLVQRRATITGASPTTKHSIDIEQFWKMLKKEHSTSFQLRDKAASCAHGLDNVKGSPRPQTCLGLVHQNLRKSSNLTGDGKKVKFQDVLAEIENDRKITDLTQNVNQKQSNINLLDNIKKNDYPPDTPAEIHDTINNNCNTNNGFSPRILTNSDEKDRGKLHKSQSTPTYDFSDSDEIMDKQIILDQLNYNLKPLKQGSPNSFIPNKTDHGIDKENIRNNINCMNKQKESHENKKMTGNVAKKINDMEKIIKRTGIDHEKIIRSRESLVHIEVTDADEDHCSKSSINKGIGQDNHVVVEASINALTPDMSRTSSEGEFESSSYEEETYSENTSITTNNESLAADDTSNSTTTSQNQTNKDSNEESITVDNRDQENNNEIMIDAIAPNIQQHKNALVENISAKYPTRPKSPKISSLFTDEIKESPVVKPEVKPRMTPPEPPPRKYFAKPPPLNINSSLSSLKEQQKPQVPERPSVRRDLKKFEVSPDPLPKEDKLRKNDRFESYSDFVEKSTDFIDDPSTPNTPGSRSMPTTLMDSYGYTQIAETFNIKDERYANEIYSDKSSVLSNSSASDRNKFELYSTNLDSPDGCFGRKTQSPENKSRTLEKDKGVVNRAMMVARSIGLPGSSAKSTNSPRTIRKRNTILAKRRNVSVKDLGHADLEGWLTYRSRGAGGAWARAWFILKSSSFYRFKTHESTRADCLITLSGCTVSQAPEVKSRKYAFKVYHTGTVFYFAADTDDSLTLWLDAINKATIGTDPNNHPNAIFSETDESDSEVKNKTKAVSPDSKPLLEKTFGSLKKANKKDSSNKEEAGGASLDRKYLKFLSSRTQNVPVPTAQFRSYRRVLPSTPNRKPEKIISPDLQMTIAGSTFYGLNASQSANDVLSVSQDMGDYRRTNERPRYVHSNQRPEETQNFITLEQFMLSRQEEECQRANNINFTPLNNDHVHFQHPQQENVPRQPRYSNGNRRLYGSSRNISHELMPAPPTPSYSHSSHNSFDSDNSFTKNELPSVAKTSKYSYHHQKNSTFEPSEFHTNSNYSGYESPECFDQSDQRLHQVRPGMVNSSMNTEQSGMRLTHNESVSGSNGNLSHHMSPDNSHRNKKEPCLSRNGSFNATERRRKNYMYPEKNWIDSKRDNDRRPLEKQALKSVAQYQPPPLPTALFEQEGMRTFEMYLDKDHKKGTKLRNFFISNKNSQKNNSHDPQPEPKTLLGSPRLHRAIFRDRHSNKSNVSPVNQRFGSTSQTCNYYGDDYFPPSPNSCNCNLDQYSNNCTDEGNICSTSPQKSNANRLKSPPTLPYIPPPTSPPPDYPGLEYPPVFEPGTYSLADASLLRNRGRESDNSSDL